MGCSAWRLPTAGWVDKHYGYAFQWFGLFPAWCSFFMSGSNLSDVYPPLAASQTPEPTGQRAAARAASALAVAGVLLACAAPVIAPYFTYYVIRPEGRRNFGELVEPQRPMPAEALVVALDGQPRKLGELRDQWLLVSVGAAAATQTAATTCTCSVRCARPWAARRSAWTGLAGQDDAALPADIAPALEQATVLRADDARRWRSGWSPQAGHGCPSTCMWSIRRVSG